MRLKTNINTSEFMKAVQQCSKDVFFISPEGDQLNLKSTLSQFLFAMLQSKPELLSSGSIVCEAGDAEYLRAFIQG